MTFLCPSCDQPLLAEPEMSGEVIRCPQCGVKLQVPHPPKKRFPLARPSPEPSPQDKSED